MTKTQYEDYRKSVNIFLTRNKIKPGCFAPYYDEDGDCKDPFFSWTACGCCERAEGGNRETYQFISDEYGEFDTDICTDCVYYLTYDKLDDLTMLEIEQSA